MNRPDEPYSNARFWFYFNEWVKVTLTPGQVLSYSTGGATDEGYDVTEYQLSYDGRYVLVEIERDARDCDGRMTDSRELECRVGELRTAFNENTRLHVPNWQRVSSRHRDFSAEASGY